MNKRQKKKLLSRCRYRHYKDFKQNYNHVCCRLGLSEKKIDASTRHLILELLMLEEPVMQNMIECISKLKYGVYDQFIDFFMVNKAKKVYDEPVTLKSYGLKSDIVIYDETLFSGFEPGEVATFKSNNLSRRY